MTSSRLKRSIARQFGHPSGFLGQVAGWIMAHRPSNRQRNTWVVDLIQPRPADRIIEIGCGPGLALEQLAPRLGSGHAIGIDHSTTMLEQAGRRLGAHIAAGKVQLAHASVEQFISGAADLPGPFDKVLAINVAKFWSDLDATIAGLARKLAPGGQIAILHQPRMTPATDAAAREVAECLEAAMRSAALEPVQTHELSELSPIAVCTVGTRADDTAPRSPPAGATHSKGETNGSQ